MVVSRVCRRSPAIHNQFGNKVPRTKREKVKETLVPCTPGLAGVRAPPWEAKGTSHHPPRCRLSGGVFEMVGSSSSAIQSGRLVHKNAAGSRGGAAPIFSRKVTFLHRESQMLCHSHFANEAFVPRCNAFVAKRLTLLFCLCFAWKSSSIRFLGGKYLHLPWQISNTLQASNKSRL